MRRGLVLCTFVLFAAAVLMGASPARAYDTDAAAKSFGAATLHNRVPVAVLRGWQGGDSAIAARRYARVVDESSWSALWQAHAPGTAVPAVDFDKEMVVAIFAGTVDDNALRIPLYSVSEADSIEVTTMNYISDVMPSGSSTPYVIAVLPLSMKSVTIVARSYALMRAPQTHYQVMEEFAAVTPALFLKSGDDLRAKGDADRAIAAYGRALKLDPDFAWAYERRGSIWLDRGDYPRAIADFDQAIRIEPNHAPFFNSRCWALAVSGGDAEKALGDCDRSLQLKPGDSDVLDSRAFVYLRLGRLDAALADYDAALAKDAKLWSSFYGRGLVRLRKGDAAAGNADIAAAKAMKADVVETFARFGFKPE